MSVLLSFHPLSDTSLLRSWLVVCLCSLLFSTQSSCLSDNFCEVKTINHITNALPQQCFRTSWNPPEPTASSDNVSTVDEKGPPSPATLPVVGDDLDGARKKPNDRSFMTFEEWKDSILQKTGQDASNLHGKQKHGHSHESGLDGGIYSLGDDGEIALNFDALYELPADSSTSLTSQSHVPVDPDLHDEILYDGGETQYRSKDAGITCKERFSYSSFDAGATVLKTNSGAKNPKAILLENKDSYMLLECAVDNKYVIVELSDDILVDTVVLANFEFFSSMIRHFRVSVSDRYPVKLDKWKDLGTFEARNSRDIQAFLVENPRIWAKYVRIEFITHYGNEYYCPVSLLRVHGTRMLESWKESEQGQEEEDTHEITVSDILPIEQDASSGEQPRNAPFPGSWTTGLYQCFWNSLPLEICPAPNPPRLDERDHSFIAVLRSTGSCEVQQPETPPGDIKSASHFTMSASVPSSQTSVHPTTPPGTPPKIPLTANTYLANTVTPSQYSDSQPQANNPEVPTKVVNSTLHTPKSPSTSLTTSGVPAVQEGFFKSVTKRLQLLENNITWSIKYIEDQSHYLEDSLIQLETLHHSKVDKFLAFLNQTVFAELHNLQEQYDQIWQSTVITLESQRDQSQKEVLALTARLNMVADEMLFQKRMSIGQSILLLSCLVLIIFSRSIQGPPLAQSEIEREFLPHGKQELSNPAHRQEYLDPRDVFKGNTDNVYDLNSQFLTSRAVLLTDTWQDGTDLPWVNEQQDPLTNKRHVPPPSIVYDNMGTQESARSTSTSSSYLSEQTRFDTSRNLGRVVGRKPLPALPEYPDTDSRVSI